MNGQGAWERPVQDADGQWGAGSSPLRRGFRKGLDGRIACRGACEVRTLGEVQVEPNLSVTRGGSGWRGGREMPVVMEAREFAAVMGVLTDEISRVGQDGEGGVRPNLPAGAPGCDDAQHVERNFPSGPCGQDGEGDHELYVAQNLEMSRVGPRGSDGRTRTRRASFTEPRNVPRGSDGSGRRGWGAAERTYGAPGCDDAQHVERNFPSGRVVRMARVTENCMSHRT